MKATTTVHWAFSTTGLPTEALPAFKHVVDALHSHDSGIAYMEGKLEKQGTHEKMQQMLTERLTAADFDSDNIKAAVALLDHIQQKGHEWGWFKKPAKSRTAYSNCGESWLWDKSILQKNDSKQTKGRSKTIHRTNAQRINDFYDIEEAICKFLALPDQDPLALLGCLQASLITRCSVIARATLNACLVSLRHPVLATQNWWYLDVTHRSGKNQRLELRRIFLDPVTGSLAIRWHTKIAPLLSDIATCDRQKALSERAFNAFARIAKLPSGIRTTDAMQSASAWMAVSVPGFLMSVATRKRITHSIPNDAWRRLLGLVPLMGDTTSPHTPYRNLDQLQIPISDTSAFSRLLELIGQTSTKPFSLCETQKQTLNLTEKLLAEWLVANHAHPRHARLVVLLLGNRLQAALAEQDQPYTTESLSSIRGFMTEDLEQEDLIELADAFVDWLAMSSWAVPTSSGEDDEDNPGVSANILSPHEQQQLNEYLDHPACGIADKQLREILKIIIEFGCLGMRRAEALKLRVIDFRSNTAATHPHPIIAIEPYKERRLKSVSSKRFAPARLLNPTLIALLSEAHGRPSEEMLIAAYQLSPHSDQTIWLAANRAIQQFLQDRTLHLHHCRHAAATLLLLQLMAAPLGLHRYQGRCQFLDSLLHTSEHVADILTCKNPCSLTHLRAISLLLGHLSPLITLKTYIHSCDMMLYFALDRAGEDGYSEVLSLASGRPLETVKYHQELSAQTREHMAQQTLPSPLQLTSDGYSLLRQVERHFPEGVHRNDMPLTYEQSHTDAGSTFSNIAELMSQIYQHPTPDEQIAVSSLMAQEKNDNILFNDFVPKLRNGVMTTTASDWAARLHRTFSKLNPIEEMKWKEDLRTFLQDIDTHRSLIRIRKEPGTDAIIDILKRMNFKVRDWQVRPPQERGAPPTQFHIYRTWRDILNAGRPLQLRPTLPANTFSYEGARWAVMGHLLYLTLRSA